MNPLSEDQIESIVQWMGSQNLKDGLEEIATCFRLDFSKLDIPLRKTVCQHENTGDDWDQKYCKKCLVDLPPEPTYKNV